MQIQYASASVQPFCVECAENYSLYNITILQCSRFLITCTGLLRVCKVLILKLWTWREERTCDRLTLKVELIQCSQLSLWLPTQVYIWLNCTVARTSPCVCGRGTSYLYQIEGIWGLMFLLLITPSKDTVWCYKSYIDLEKTVARMTSLLHSRHHSTVELYHTTQRKQVDILVLRLLFLKNSVPAPSKCCQYHMAVLCMLLQTDELTSWSSSSVSYFPGERARWAATCGADAYYEKHKTMFLESTVTLVRCTNWHKDSNLIQWRIIAVSKVGRGLRGMK